MSHSNPPRPSRADAVESDFPSLPPADDPPSDFGRPAPPTLDSRIEREIERSERASAALMATRAMARAAFTDSQLAAEEAAHADDPDHDFDAGGWTRTEYVAFDPTPQPEPPRNLVGGSFNPGIASQHGRQYPGASITTSPIKTRSGAQARFAHESRQAPRSDRAAGAVARPEPELPPSGAHYDKPAVIPMLAPATAPPAAARPPAPARGRASEPARFVLAAALGAAVVLAVGALAWKSGLMARGNPDNAAPATPAVAPPAEAARIRSEVQDIPAAPAPRSDAEVDAALAAAARAAAVPTASVRAASPRLMAPAAPASHAAPVAKESVSEAIARAQARADRFLAPEAAAASEPKPGE